MISILLSQEVHMQKMDDRLEELEAAKESSQD